MRSLVALVVAACGPATTQPTGPGAGNLTPAPADMHQTFTAPGDACTADADCVVTNFPGCCACPQCSVGRPTARSRSALATAEQVCTVAECDGHACDVGGMCPPGESADHFVPHCTAGTCTATHR